MSLPELTLTTEKNQRNVQANRLTVRESEKGLTLVANIVSGNGLPYDLTGLTLQFCENKQDGKAIIDPAVSVLDSKNGRISYVLHSQAYACSGSAWFEILSGTTLVDSTQNFSIKVESTTNVNVDSSDYIWDTQLADTIKKAGDIEAQAKAVLDDIQKNPDKYRGVKGDTGTVDNAGLTTAPAFVALQTQVNNSAVGTNLFSQSTATAGYVNASDGTVTPANSSSNEIVSDYIPVSASSAYTFQMRGTTPSGQNYWYGIGQYDSDKNFISRSAGIGNTQSTNTTEHMSQTITTTSTTAYVRVSFRKYNDYKAKLEKGRVSTDWCPNPSEILTQADYAKIKAAIVALGGSLS